MLTFPHLVPVSDRVDDGELELDGRLLQLVGVRLEPHLALLVGGRGGLEGGVEEGVHQGGLAQAGLADAQDVEGEPALHGLVHQLVGQGVEPDVAAEVKGAEAVGRGRVGGGVGAPAGGGVHGGGRLGEEKKG